MIPPFYLFKKVGPDYRLADASLRHPTCKEECPDACSDQWEYYHNSRWHVDRSINVSCGILFTIPLPF